MAHSPNFPLKINLDQQLNKSRQIILSRGIVSASRLALGLPAPGLRKKAIKPSRHFTLVRAGRQQYKPLSYGTTAALQPPGFTWREAPAEIARDAK